MNSKAKYTFRSTVILYYRPVLYKKYINTSKHDADLNDD